MKRGSGILYYGRACQLTFNVTARHEKVVRYFEEVDEQRHYLSGRRIRATAVCRCLFAGKGFGLAVNGRRERSAAGVVRGC